MKSLVIGLLLLGSHAKAADELATAFVNPPAAARPWVYWFWNNGNVTRAGITADLEAMQRVGIGGVILMDVVERFAPPPGTADFMNPEWRELFQFSVSEAHRLGLEINMTNGPGWCGSSGPWITPELSMQKLVASSVTIEGPTRTALALPKARADYYRDIAVLAYPKTADGFVALDQVLNLTDKLDTDGHLKWEVPAGTWVVQRIGHMSTGATTRPPVKGGSGLECDKLSAEAMEVQFNSFIGKLAGSAGTMTGPTLSATHIDSWEEGEQTWTPKFATEFKKRRGYDPLPYLPDVMPPVEKMSIGTAEVKQRSVWDFQQTRAELLAENYVGKLAELAHAKGMRLTMEGYNLPFGDEASYTEPVDEPMTEFWTMGGNETLTKARQMASVAHIMGRKVVGAEAFTSGDTEQWKMHPATIKALGDYEFSQGVNRFVIHRYAHQPYLDRFPGATMGPWGLHYERTQTWWEMSGAWHRYLSRCQHLLRQGLYVADICYLRPEQPDQTYFIPQPAPPEGYRYDECSSGALIARMSVKDGRLTLPDGMSYRVLVLPDTKGLMTPALMKKIKELVEAGATVIGSRPSASPGMAGYPDCDREVASMAAEVWGDINGPTVTEHAFGKGRMIAGQPLTTVLEKLGAPVDFSSSLPTHWIHRRVGDKEVYFVANSAAAGIDVECRFRASGMQPELWNPETGEMERVASYREVAGGIAMPLALNGSGSVFVVFQPAAKAFDPVVGFTREGKPVTQVLDASMVTMQSASYGVPGDAARTRNVLAKVQALIAAGQLEFQVSSLAEGDDPARGTVKTLDVEFAANGKSYKVSGHDQESINLTPTSDGAPPAAEVRCSADGAISVAAGQAGTYELKTAGGRAVQVVIASVPAVQEIGGAWDLRFPAKWGAPERVTMDSLSSWSDSPAEGVQHFSGTATYVKTFDWKPMANNGKDKQEFRLDLGEVQVMAHVKLNGKDLGILWRQPFQVDATGFLVAGKNTLEIAVANLWPNRMIADAGLPEEKRLTWSSYEPFKATDPLLKSGLIGPVRLEGMTVMPVK